MGYGEGLPSLFHQRRLEHLRHLGDEVEGECVADVFGQVFQVLVIFLGQDDIGDTRAVCTEHLFLIPPTGSTWPRRVISPVIATLRRTGCAVKAEMSAVASVMPAEGPSLGICPSGTWM